MQVDGREAIDPTSFRFVDRPVFPIWRWFTAPFEVLATPDGLTKVLPIILFILLVGLLGLAGVMISSQRAELESYQRVQGLIILQDIVGRINANRNVAACYAFTTNAAAGTVVTNVSTTMAWSLTVAATLVMVSVITWLVLTCRS